MNSTINNFLKKYRTDGIIYTHVSMINPKGKFQMNRKQVDDFWNMYCESISNDKDIISGIGEKVNNYLPVLVDVDLKLKEDEDTNYDRLYDDTQIINTVEVYQSVLRNIVEDCTDDNLICFVLEKPFLSL